MSMRPKVKISAMLDQVELSLLANIIERDELSKKVIVGRKNLGRFLIDVNKVSTAYAKNV